MNALETRRSMHERSCAAMSQAHEDVGTVHWATVVRMCANPEVFLDTENVESLRTRCVPVDMAVTVFDSMDGVLEAIQDWKDEQATSFNTLQVSCMSASAAERFFKSLLVSMAPMASVMGCWLQGMSAPGVFEDRTCLQGLTLLATDAGVGGPHGSRYHEYCVLMSRMQLQSFAVAPANLAQLPDIPDALFQLPATLLAMSRRADVFGPELHAVDLTLRAVGLWPGMLPLAQKMPDAVNWERLDMAKGGIHAPSCDPLVLSLEIGRRIVDQSEEMAGRLYRALRWTLIALQGWNQSVRDNVACAVNPTLAMTAFVRARAHDASAYHHARTFNGCPLSTHFKNAGTDVGPLLHAIATSPVVKPGDASKSRLVNELVSARGKMFRVFRDDELAVIKDWIDQLPQTEVRSESTCQKSNPLPGPQKHVRWREVSPGDGDQGVRPSDLRDAYFLLQGRATPPRTRRFMTDYVEYWMRSVNKKAGNCTQALPISWSHGGLGQWLTAQHDAHNAVFQSHKHNALPTREAVIDSTLQLAPLICIDGAWLQGFTDMGLATSRVGAPLFEIYWDELGNGQLELNHPKIYRDLLRQMEVDIAPIGSRAFTQDVRIKTESFRLPVLWLCLGKLPVTYLPEILGMNLAMELSGVGDGYRLAHRFLKHYGFSTQFVDLHNTIDNVCTGHSAWAVTAIQQHMQALLPHGEAVAQAAWRRIRTGYSGLTTVPSISPAIFRSVKTPFAHDLGMLHHHGYRTHHRL